MNNLAILKNNFCEVENNNLKSQLAERGFGTKISTKKLTLDLFESRYLQENKKIKIKKENKIISEKEYQKILVKKIKQFEEKYAVFKSFRDSGHIVKDGTIFGFDFRIYDKNEKNNEHNHTKYVVDVINTNKNTKISEIIKSERLAGTINADFILAIVDNDNKIIKIKIKRADT